MLLLSTVKAIDNPWLDTRLVRFEHKQAVWGVQYSHLEDGRGASTRATCTAVATYSRKNNPGACVKKCRALSAAHPLEYFSFSQNGRATFASSPLFDWGNSHGVRAQRVDSKLPSLSRKSRRNKNGWRPPDHRMRDCSCLLLLSSTCDGS